MTHNDIYALLLTWCCLIICPAVAMMIYPWLKLKLRMLTLRIKIVLCDIAVWGIRTHCRHKNIRLMKREQRRMRSAMRVLDEPVRWCNDAENRRSAQRLRQR